MIWWKIVLILCVFGFLKEFRPSEPFISPYLNGPWKNFTEAEINQDVFPVGTYSTFILLIVVFLLTDWLRYKPVIIIEGVAGILTWSLLCWGEDIFTIQICQVFYGLFCASEVAYFGYLYTKVEKKHYQVATSLTKTALLIGKASSGLISQILILFHLMDYHQLNYLTIGAMSLCTLWALFLPSVPESVYFHKSEVEPLDEEKGNVKLQNDPSSNSDKLNPTSEKNIQRKIQSNSNYMYIYKDFQTAYKNPYVFKWSIWWAMSMCGYLQVTNYMQLLWQAIINEDVTGQKLYHGFSNSAHSLTGAICTYLVGFLKLKWDVYGELVLALCSILQGSLLVYTTWNSDLLVSYGLYITFRVLYQAGITIASSEIAKHLEADSYALVFGINTFVALLGQSILTFVVIYVLELNIYTQFIIYGSYYVVIGFVFFLIGTATLVTALRK